MPPMVAASIVDEGMMVESLSCAEVGGLHVVIHASGAYLQWGISTRR
jgi:hypothetical protein